MKRWLIVCALLAAAVRAEAVDISDLLEPMPWDTPRLAESKRILRLNPSDEMALFGLSHGYYEIARYEEAVRVYDRMIEIRVQWMHYAESDRATVLERMDRIEEAERGFRNAMRIMENFPHPYAGLATMWLRRGERLPEAEDYLEKAIGYETAEYLKVCYRVQLGAVKLAQGEIDDAIDILEAAKSALPTNLVRENYPINDIEAIYEVRYHLACAYAKQGRLAEAESELDEVIHVYNVRRAAAPQARQSIMPTGTWQAIEHPDRFRFLFERWKLP